MQVADQDRRRARSHPGHDASIARCACIDIGSNTTRLLVAEDLGPGLREVLGERAFTRIAAAQDADGRIADDKVAEVAQVVAGQVRLARELGCESIRAVATAAVRGAPNAAQLVAAVAAVAGVRVTVLAAGEEARLAFCGAMRTLADAPPDGELGLVDVGGGSTEVILGASDGTVRWSTSLPLGSSALATGMDGDPPTAADLDAGRAVVARAFAGLTLVAPAGAYAVGGGTASLRRLAGPVVDGAALERALTGLGTDPASQSAARLGLRVERVRLLFGAILLLEAATAALGPLRLAGGGLREGIALEELARSRSRTQEPR